MINKCNDHPICETLTRPASQPLGFITLTSMGSQGKDGVQLKVLVLSFA